MSNPLHALGQTLQSLVRTLFRLALIVGGAMVALAALVMGLMLTVGLVSWALLRGRRPSAQQSFVWRGRKGPGRPSAGTDVVDVDVHEVRGAVDPKAVHELRDVQEIQVSGAARPRPFGER
jgi:hypothetical protein